MSTARAHTTARVPARPASRRQPAVPAKVALEIIVQPRIVRRIKGRQLLAQRHRQGSIVAMELPAGGLEALPHQSSSTASLQAAAEHSGDVCLSVPVCALAHANPPPPPPPPPPPFRPVLPLTRF